MEIKKQQLENAIRVFNKKRMDQELNHIYKAIPGGSCTGCAKCCTESVNTFFAEFIQIYNYLYENEMLERMLKPIENHYVNELVKQQNCPFLGNNKSCMIYPVRPLVCRLFGHASQKDHDANYQAVKMMNLEADTYFFDTYGVHIGSEVLNHKIDYCHDFKPAHTFTMEQKNNLIDQMFQLDSEFLMLDLIPEDAINIGLTNWFMYLIYSEKEASELRISKLLNENKM